MTQSDRLQTALHAADEPIMIVSPSQAARAAKVWRRCALLAMDTEFVRERTYHANLGLVQISDGQTVWLLDPLEDGVIEPLAELLANESIIKLFHSPSEDLEVLRHVTGQLPEPLIDSQLACALLGQPLQLGYHKAVEWLLGVPIDKELTRSNWMARPLKPALLRYAALDVCVLPLMWESLRGRLEALNRVEWLEEDCARMLEGARQPVDPQASWQRIKGIGRLDGRGLGVLQALAAWRERQAAAQNRPRGFIIPDPVLLVIARERMTDATDLEQLEDLHPRARKRFGNDIVRTVQQALEENCALPPVPQAGPRERAALKKMRALVRRRADTLDLDPAVLASKRDLEELLFSSGNGELPERLCGWRREEIGEPLLALKAKLGDSAD